MAQRRSPDDPLHFLAAYATPEHRPRWREQPYLDERVRQRMNERIEGLYVAGGNRLMILVRSAMPLCEENPLIVAPPADSNVITDA